MAKNNFYNVDEHGIYYIYDIYILFILNKNTLNKRNLLFLD